MLTPGQVRRDGYSEVLSVLYRSKLPSQRVNRFGFILSMCNTYDLAFVRIKVHLPFICPCAQSVKVTLQSRDINIRWTDWAVDFSIICINLDSGCQICRDVIYVDDKQNRAKNCSLGYPRLYWRPIRTLASNRPFATVGHVTDNF